MLSSFCWGACFLFFLRLIQSRLSVCKYFILERIKTKPFAMSVVAILCQLSTTQWTLACQIALCSRMWLRQWCWHAQVNSFSLPRFFFIFSLFTYCHNGNRWNLHSLLKEIISWAVLTAILCRHHRCDDVEVQRIHLLRGCHPQRNVFVDLCCWSWRHSTIRWALRSYQLQRATSPPLRASSCAGRHRDRVVQVGWHRLVILYSNVIIYWSCTSIFSSTEIV